VCVLCDVSDVLFDVVFACICAMRVMVLCIVSVSVL
jgi:hypothetical protein